MRPSTLAPTLLVLLAGSVGAQTGEPRFVERTVAVAGRRFRYQVYLPAGYAERRRWPVILFLHGAGERGTDGRRQTTVGLGPALRAHPRRFPAIVVFPQAPPDSQWVGLPAEAALAALDRTLAEFRGDPDRVYLTGISMGGHGAWYLAYRHPERFAALAPICGWVEERPEFPGSVPVVPSDSGPVLPALARRLAGMPIWIFHGEADSVVPVGASRGAAAALRAGSSAVRYTEYPGLGHNVWDAAYGSDDFARWLLAQRRR